MADLIGWSSLAGARNLWPVGLEDGELQTYLDAARQAVEAYAPALPSGETTVPEHWVLAQVMQARNLFNAARANPASGDVDAVGYALAARPLDWHVRQILRPKRGKPVVG